MKRSLLIVDVLLFIILLTSVCAQSQSATAYPTSLPVPVRELSGIVYGEVNGHVLDTNGNPVSNAVVTLWKDGEISSPSGGIVGNPQTTRIYSYNYDTMGDVGFFDFFSVYPGQYVVMAEKDGHNGSATVSVNNNLSTANITLNGYHEPILSKELLAHTGAITGVVLDRNGVLLPGTNVSLWQNGRLVRIPNNPQLALGGKEMDEFLFEHIPPGRYELLADTTNRLGGVEVMAVDVYNSMVTANFTMHNYTYFSRGPQIPVNTPAPSPFADSFFVLLTIITVALIHMHIKKLPPLTKR